MRFKYTLLAATVITSVIMVPANAQVALPAPSSDGDAALHGAGATSIQNVLVRAANCTGIDQQQGNGQPGGSASTSNGSLKTISAGSFTATPSLDCSVADTSTSSTNIQPNFSLKYVGTGSGFGRKSWYWFADAWDGSANTSKAQAHVVNPFNLIKGDARWSHIQFAFTDTPVAPSEIALYNTTGNALTQAGPAISFPLFVLPVAVAYSSQYGTNAKGTALIFNAQNKATYGTATVAVLNLSRNVYCGIFNGVITNWNDASIQALNGKSKVKGQVGIPLYDTVNDTAARWTTDGAPIRLVGRLDNSGTTDVFTRHLAQVCNTSGTNTYAGVNNYTINAENLPFNASTNGGIDFRTVRADTNYNPSAASSKFAGSTNMVSGDYWTGSTVTNIASGTPSGAPTGNKGSGLYTTANGGGALATYVSLAPDYSIGSTISSGYKFNGKIGYISADFIQPSVDAPGGLVAANLENKSDGKFYNPTYKTALAAFTAALVPPQSDSTGAFVATDTRQVRQPDGSNGNATRSNPIAWADVLYKTAGYSLADPQNTGAYPIVGTTQFVGYTCYASKGNREQIVDFLGLLLGQVKKNAANVAVSPKVFGGSTPAVTGVIDQSNIAIVPLSWATAITNTFLTKSATDAGAAALNLYIQDALLPTPAKGVVGKKSYVPQADPNANSVCTSVVGA